MSVIELSVLLGQRTATDALPAQCLPLEHEAYTRRFPFQQGSRMSFINVLETPSFELGLLLLRRQLGAMSAQWHLRMAQLHGQQAVKHRDIWCSAVVRFDLLPRESQIESDRLAKPVYGHLLLAVLHHMSAGHTARQACRFCKELGLTK